MKTRDKRYWQNDTIAHLQKECHRIAVEHGWWEDGYRNFGEQIALMHSELSEALEAWRDNSPTVIGLDGSVKPDGVVVELADVIIRIMDTCERYGWNLTEALVAKMQYNESRSYRHGGKLA